MSIVKLPKTFLFQAIQFIQTVLIQLIKFSMLDIKTVLYYIYNNLIKPYLH